jgi:O-antigen/teichoic acid export membrane protein
MMIIILGIRLTTHNPVVHLAAYPAAIATVALFHVFSYATVFRAFEEMEINSAGLVLSRLVFFLLVLVAIKLETGIIGILTALALSSLLLWGIFYIIVSKKYLRPRLSFHLSTCRYMLREGLSTGGAIILRKTLWYVDIFMLKTLATSVAVGLFNSVYQIIQIFYLIPWTVAVPFMPVFSRLAKTDPKQLLRMLNTLLKFSWLITLPLALWTVFIGHDMIQSIYGAKFSMASEGLKIIVWTLPFLFPTSFFFSFSRRSEDKDLILSVWRLPSLLKWQPILS